MAAQLDVCEATLVVILANLGKGEVCFLCSSSNGTKCVWDEIGDDITGYGWSEGIAYKDRRERMHMPPLSLAEFHKACFCLLQALCFYSEQLVSWDGPHPHSCMCQSKYSDDLPW